MKVIFRINADKPSDYTVGSMILKESLEVAQDSGYMIVPKNVDVFVVDPDSEIKIMPQLPDYISEEARIKGNIPIEYCFGWKDCLDTIKEKMK